MNADPPLKLELRVSLFPTSVFLRGHILYRHRQGWAGVGVGTAQHLTGGQRRGKRLPLLENIAGSTYSFPHSLTLPTLCARHSLGVEEDIIPFLDELTALWERQICEQMITTQRD